jgi:TRAP-type uncharacterized transport system substrate-binding protein
MTNATQAMAEAARLDLQSHGVEVSQETAWQAVDAALAVASEPAPTMSRVTILEEATKAVDAAQEKAKALGTNSRGYTDNYTPASIAERTQAILELARFLAGDERG